MKTSTFLETLERSLDRAAARGENALVVTAGSLHGLVGGYPGPNHRMPACCAAMRKAMRAGDIVVQAPPSGNGASFTARYALPR